MNRVGAGGVIQIQNTPVEIIGVYLGGDDWHRQRAACVCVDGKITPPAKVEGTIDLDHVVKQRIEIDALDADVIACPREA